MPQIGIRSSGHRCWITAGIRRVPSQPESSRDHRILEDSIGTATNELAVFASDFADMMYGHPHRALCIVITEDSAGAVIDQLETRINAFWAIERFQPWSRFAPAVSHFTSPSSGSRWKSGPTSTSNRLRPEPARLIRAR